jgi:hypothetical protein
MQRSGYELLRDKAQADLRAVTGALDALQQARQVTLGPFAGFGAGKAVADPRVQRRPSVHASLDRGQPKSARYPVHLLPSAVERGQRTALPG